MRRNVLIFHNAALGDFVLTWPVAIALARVMAQSRVKYVTASQKGQLAEHAIGVEYADSELGWHALYGDGVALPEAPGKLLAGLQLAVVFQQGGEAAEKFTANLRRIAGDVPVITIAPNPPAETHVWAHHLPQLAAVPWLATAVSQVQGGAQSRGLVAAPPGDVDRVIIHPGSGAPRKNWPIENFLAVAKGLRDRGHAVTFVLGEVEREQMPPDAVAQIASIADVASPATLIDLHNTLASGRIYIGNDSGPTHLAAALGRRVIALFGPTSNAVAWGPVGPHVRILDFQSETQDVMTAAIS